MCDVTQILGKMEAGDPLAAEQLLPLVYEELRKLAAAKMAQEKPGQTLQATALVHEAYIRLVDVEKVQHWNSRGHFFAAAAEAMRRILINHARDKKRLRRGGHLRKVDIDKVEITMATPDDDLLALDEALQKLAEEHPECAKLATCDSSLACPWKRPVMRWEFQLALQDGIGLMPEHGLLTRSDTTPIPLRRNFFDFFRESALHRGRNCAQTGHCK